MSAASFLGITGLIAFYGFDGFMYSVGWLVAYLAVLLLVAEPLRNTGKYTLADIISFRLRGRGVRAIAALSTLAITLFYLIAQMVGGSALVNLLLPQFGDNVAIVVVGVLMLVYVLFGGMLATTWVQIIKAALLLVHRDRALAARDGALPLLARRRSSTPRRRCRSAASDDEPAPARAALPRPARRVEPHLARAGARAGHRRTAAHPDALLHRAVGAGGAHVGRVGDGARSALLSHDVVHGTGRGDDRRQGAHRHGVCTRVKRSDTSRIIPSSKQRLNAQLDARRLHRPDTRQQPRRAAARGNSSADRCSRHSSPPSPSRRSSPSSRA